MKIRSMRLSAYGPFTDVTIDLPNTGTDFHILYGPNEAGKSSALKAIRHMLFGVPAREPVNFIHSYPSLRVGAELVNSNGEKLEFLRRKGRAKTLRGPDDETVLDEKALASFLGGVNAEVFEQMFAIGHDDLIKGGEEIISGKGSVGEALFAAGAGLIRLQNVQKTLDQQCGELFKPSGSTPSINQKIKSIKIERQNQKSALLLPKTWKDRSRELSDAGRRMDEVKTALVSYKQKQVKLERIKEALPLIVRKKEIDADLMVYQGVPELADDFGEKRRDAEKELKVTTKDVERFQAAIELVGKEIDALPVHRETLENAVAIESLQQSLGEYRKAQKDKPSLEGRMRTLQKQAAEMLEEIGVDLLDRDTGDMKLSPSTVGEIQKLEKTYERLTAKKEAVEDQQRKRTTRLQQLSDQRRTLPELVDVSQLENTLQLALEAGPVEKQLEEMRISTERMEGELNRTLKRQILWQGALDDIDQLPVPSKENIDRFEARFDALQRSLEKYREALAATEKDIAQAQADIQAIERSHGVPTETDLKDARGVRNKGWGLIRQQLEGHAVSAETSREFTTNFDNASNLPDAFENSMERADNISDRLWREADQVSKKGLLEALEEKLGKESSDSTTALQEIQVKRSELETEWQKIWSPADITPQTPKEMQGWLSEMAVMREKLAELRFKKMQLDSLNGQMVSLRSGLLKAFDAAGNSQDKQLSLSKLIKLAQAYIKSQNRIESNIAAADKELILLKAELEEGASIVADLDEQFSRWKTKWKTSIQKIGIRTDASPTEAVAVIESIREIRKKTDDADVLRKRIKGIDRDSADFVSRVDALVEALAPDLQSESRDRAAELLNGRLTQARKDESRHANLIEKLESSQKELENAQRRLFECRALIDSLCKEAHCADSELLAETEKQSQERKRLIKERGELEQQLRKLSAGASVEAFIEEASSMDADSISPEIQELDDESQTLEKERSELDQKIGALKAALEQMDGRSEAALHAENAERLLAGLETDVEKYARLKIAAIILARTVEQYREKHQGPLISRASELFSKMTLGAFSRLRTDYDDKGNPILVGIRAGIDAQVRVEGMSDGTADQLYLALRLASLEQYLEHNEPLPFIVDDILLRFDDDRALATLDVLAGLADKTQILFFTHHQHLVELAEKSTTPQLEFCLHRIG